METIPKQDCQKIGFFRKTHGIHGEIVLEFESHFEYSVEDATRFFVEIEGLLVPFFIAGNGLRFRAANSAIVPFDGVEDDKYAKRLIGCSVYLFNEEIVDEEEETLESRLIDYAVFDQENNKIGQITEVDDFSGNVVLTVRSKNEELLIPFNEELVIETNDTLKSIQIHLPEGLFDD